MIKIFSHQYMERHIKFIFDAAKLSLSYPAGGSTKFLNSTTAEHAGESDWIGASIL
jgi:hypothetical protein